MDFDKKFQYLQVYLNEELGLNYTQSEILDEMMDLYMARITLNSNILQTLFKETIDAALQQMIIVNAEMLNSIKETIK